MNTILHSAVHKTPLSTLIWMDQLVPGDAAILHIDRSKTANWNQRFGKDKTYPFQVNDDYLSDGFETLSTDEVDNPESEDVTNDKGLPKVLKHCLRAI